MYLLIRHRQHTSCYLVWNLHSTMYLLIPSPAVQKVTIKGEFTFHYVSINSQAYQHHINVVYSIYIPLCIY